MSRTPTTPFIPPLPTSTDSSPGPQHPPVIPTSTPNWNQPAPMGGYTPYPASPYSKQPPFIPNLSPMVVPGVMPDAFSPQQQPRVNRHGLSEDFTGYPSGSGGAPPLLSPQHQPPMSAYSHSPYSHPGSHPNSPYYPTSAPPVFPIFNTPWASNAAQLPSGTPWGGAQRLPPQGFSPYGNYGPPPPITGPPPMMGGPPNIPPPSIPPPNMPPHPAMSAGQPWPGVAAAYQQFYGPPDPTSWHPAQFGHSPYRVPVPPEPPAQIFDRMDPFTEGKGCTSIFFTHWNFAQWRD